MTEELDQLDRAFARVVQRPDVSAELLGALAATRSALAECRFLAQTVQEPRTDAGKVKSRKKEQSAQGEAPDANGRG